MLVIFIVLYFLYLISYCLAFRSLFMLVLSASYAIVGTYSGTYSAIVGTNSAIVLVLLIPYCWAPYTSIVSGNYC